MLKFSIVNGVNKQEYRFIIPLVPYRAYSPERLVFFFDPT